MKKMKKRIFKLNSNNESLLLSPLCTYTNRMVSLKEQMYGDIFSGLICTERVTYIHSICSRYIGTYVWIFARVLLYGLVCTITHRYTHMYVCICFIETCDAFKS